MEERNKKLINTNQIDFEDIDTVELRIKERLEKDNLTKIKNFDDNFKYEYLQRVLYSRINHNQKKFEDQKKEIIRNDKVAQALCITTHINSLFLKLRYRFITDEIKEEIESNVVKSILNNKYYIDFKKNCNSKDFKAITDISLYDKSLNRELILSTFLTLLGSLIVSITFKEFISLYANTNINQKYAGNFIPFEHSRRKEFKIRNIKYNLILRIFIICSLVGIYKIFKNYVNEDKEKKYLLFFNKNI